MSARKSEMVSAMGTVWEIVKAVWNAVLDLGGTDEDMRSILRKKELADSLALVILGRAEVVLREVITDTTGYLLVSTSQIVNYDRSIVDLHKAGKYDWSNDGFTDTNFPSEEKGEREVEFGIYHFNRAMTSNDVIAIMKQDGFRSATMKELLTYGERKLKEQDKYQLIALGSVSGGRCVGHLYCNNSNNWCTGLDYCYDSVWNDHHCFLAVRLKNEK